MNINIFDKLFPDDLYHSYIIEGDSEIIASLLLEFLKESGKIEFKSPDIFFEIYDSFTIDDSRKIKEWHSEKIITKDKKVCIIGTKFINYEAERALLKVLEEPTLNTHFFIVISNASQLSDTILSRTHIIKITDTSDLFKKKALEIISASIKDRIEIVSKIIKEYKDDDNFSKLRHDAIKIINQIELIYHEKWKKQEYNQKAEFILSELQKCRDYLSVPGASIKMILEHISLVL